MASNIRSNPDQALVDIADYVVNYKIVSQQAIDTACLCMTDTLAGGLDALDFPASLDTTVESSIPSYGLQMFSGAEIFRDPAKAAIFAAALEQIQKAE